MSFLNLGPAVRNIMLETKKEPASTKKNYVVHRHELPLSCPTDAMELWNAHPKVGFCGS